MSNIIEPIELSAETQRKIKVINTCANVGALASIGAGVALGMNGHVGAGIAVGIGGSIASGVIGLMAVKKAVEKDPNYCKLLARETVVNFDWSHAPEEARRMAQQACEDSMRMHQQAHDAAMAAHQEAVNIHMQNCGFM